MLNVSVKQRKPRTTNKKKMTEQEKFKLKEELAKDNTKCNYA
jgi:hypothetical protein